MKPEAIIKQKVADYITLTTNGKELMKHKTLQDVGIWQMYGEDPNCSPLTSVFKTDILLITIQGSLEQALKIAMGFPSFYTMGCGGRVKEIVVNVKYFG